MYAFVDDRSKKKNNRKMIFFFAMREHNTAIIIPKTANYVDVAVVVFLPSAGVMGPADAHSRYHAAVPPVGGARILRLLLTNSGPGFRT